MTDHIVMRPQGVGCTRCGEELAIFPCSVRVLDAASKAFAEEHAGCAEGAKRRRPSKLEKWALGWDKGTSSASIYWAFTGQFPYAGGARHDAPYDSDDFGRCVRLLDLAPEWRERLDVLAEKVPAFAPLVPEWGRLEELYRAKRYRELYAEIGRLRGRK